MNISFSYVSLPSTFPENPKRSSSILSTSLVVEPTSLESLLDRFILKNFILKKIIYTILKEKWSEGFLYLIESSRTLHLSTQTNRTQGVPLSGVSSSCVMN